MHAGRQAQYYLLDKIVLIAIRLSLEVRIGHVSKCNKIPQALCPEVSRGFRGELKGGEVGFMWVEQGESESEHWAQSRK